jgi:methylenetetrahydrofolate reductase (NADPH)
MMSSVGQSARASIGSDESLKQRIVRFVSGASTEITPSDERLLPQLVELLPPKTAVYIAHTPKTTLNNVVKAALAVQRAGFTATPHIVARRLTYPHTLHTALAELQAGGIEQILLVAGDTAQAAGEFENTLDVLASGILERSGIKRMGVAGHPEGQKAVGPTLLWDALKAKQAFSERTGIAVHIVTQFGLYVSAVPEWERLLIQQGIRLPIHVGIAGPTPLSKLIQYAILCGIGASLRTVMRNLSAAGGIADLATSPDQHVMRLVQSSETTQVVAPHFFAFGGTLETAKWINRVRCGKFEIDGKSGKFNVED